MRAGMQRLLPEMPPADVGLDALARQRLAPCSELAPPTAPPPSLRTCYVGCTASSWSVVMLNGGDMDRDSHAVHVSDAAGPVIRFDRDHAAYRGTAADHFSWVSSPELVCALSAACEALDMIMLPQGGAEREPALLRMPVGTIGGDPALAIIAGTCGPHGVAGALVRGVRQRLDAAIRLTGGRLYLAGWRASTRVPWGERSIALAMLAAGAAAPTCFGTPPPSWATVPIAPLPQPTADDTCPVCYDDYVDMLPTPDPLSRSCPGLWHEPCPHAICRGCDISVQASANLSCPMCRADRARILLP